MNSPTNTTTVALGALFRRIAAVTPAAFALLVSGALSPLSAQTAPAAATPAPIKMEAFVSTGTRFNDRTVVESPVPIDVITRAEMEQGGYTEVSQMLQSLVPSFNFGSSLIPVGKGKIRGKVAG